MIDRKWDEGNVTWIFKNVICLLSASYETVEIKIPY